MIYIYIFQGPQFSCIVILAAAFFACPLGLGYRRFKSVEVTNSQVVCICVVTWHIVRNRREEIFFVITLFSESFLYKICDIL